MKIKDFGEVIPGARRDLYNGITIDALKTLSNAQLEQYVKKHKVFPWSRERSTELIENGQTPFLVYWKIRMRKYIASTPKYIIGENYRQTMENYVHVCNIIREKLDDVKNENQIGSFHDVMTVMMEDTQTLNWRDVNNSIKEDNTDLYKKQFENGDFLGEIKKKSEPRKKRLELPRLSVVREGKDYRCGRNIKNHNWIRLFGFKGVQFGNWVNQKERQSDMNNCYDAFMDLSEILDISEKSLSLNGTLAMAFGSRGVPGAAAHYEPGRQIINLSKLHGAGSLAHEWFHALDHFLAISEGYDNGRLGTNIAINGNTSDVLDCLRGLIEIMRYDDNHKETKFYQESIALDTDYRKDSHGYWQSEHEMAARAFACYCYSKMKSTYLSGHALSTSLTGHKAYPIGYELYRCNQQFDKLFALLKEKGYLEVKSKEKILLPEITSKYSTIWTIEQELDGQMVAEAQNI